MIINLAYYESVAEGDMEFIKKMMETFLEDVPIMINAIDQAWESQDFFQLGRAVHKLKPAWGMSGMQMSILTDVEQNIRTNAEVEEIKIGIVNIKDIAAIALVEMQEKRNGLG